MLRSITNVFVVMMRKYLPDAFLFAVILTFIAFLAAFTFTDASLIKVLESWGSGMWGLLAFSMQMLLVLICGHTMASSKPVKRFLYLLAGIPQNATQAAMFSVVVMAVASLINWGFGLVVSALVARELARRIKDLDYAFTVAAGYSGYVVWHHGLSGSVPLAVATSGHQLEKFFIENGLDPLIPVTQTIFSSANITITGIIVLTLPILFIFMTPSKENIVRVDPAILEEPEEIELKKEDMTPAQRLENCTLISMLLGGLGVTYLVWHFATKGFVLNLNIINMTFFFIGVLLHKTPINFVRAMNEAIKGAAGIAVQFPLYAGIQGIMVHTGLAAVIANGFIAISTPETLPLYSFLSAGLINVFVPSGGGQWVIQGPINIPAAISLGVDPAKVAMAVAYGDSWTNMIQPFWALPMLGIAKLGVRDIMGYCVVTLFWSGAIVCLGLYFL